MPKAGKSLRMHDKLCTITFLPSGIKAKAVPGTKLLDIAWGKGMDVNSVCGGNGTCGKCRGRIVAGNAGEPTKTERDLFSEEELRQGMGLLCQREITGDLWIELENPGGSAQNFMPVKGNYFATGINADPVIAKTFHQLASPTAVDQAADLDRILNDLPGNVTIAPPILPLVPQVIREGAYNLTTTVYADEIIALEAGDTTSQMFGLAFDIGTTSVAGYLVDLRAGRVLAAASAANKQRVHGADVISRISYSVEKPGGLLEMKELISQTLNELVYKLLAQTGVSPEQVYLATLVGNTVMSHFLLGVTPAGVASSPFVPSFTRSVTGATGFLGLTGIPETARFILLPNVAGYVGADTVGVMLSTNIHAKPGNWLAVDIGTNGEVVLSTNGRLLTCSTAAGPAFEGASIGQGMRAEPGAINKVEMRDDVRVEVMGGQEPKGICGSGLLDAVAELLKLGIVRPNGRIKNPAECPPDLPERIKSRIRKTEKGLEFLLAAGEKDIVLTQKDIGELQLAKGALRAGIEILLLEAGVTELDGILLAGAFGSNLRLESLQRIGMLPEIDLHRVKPVGNAAGTGSIMALLSKKNLQMAYELPRKTEHVELSLHKGFPRQFARAMGFT